jgi:thiol-disulfide isomerase/thioredoxin
MSREREFTANIIQRLAITILITSLALPVTAGAQATGLDVNDLNVGDEAPTFVMKEMGTTEFIFLRDMAGELRQSAVLEGATPKVVVLSFFASWCKPCAEEMPHLSAIAERYAERDVRVFFVNLSETDGTVERWLAENPNIKGMILMDPYAENAIKYGVEALPRTIVIGKEGVVRYIERGFETEGYQEKVEDALDSVLGGGAK